MFLILQLFLLAIIFLFLNCYSFLFSKKILIDLILDVVFCLLIFSFFILCCCLFYNIQFEIEYTYWINSFLLKIKWAFILDNLNSLMLFFITLIACFVILFSLDYLYLDPFLIKFISYLFLFTFFMLLLITGQHFLQLFLGWEGVGLCSYLLIGFWSTRVNAHKSALKALIINRIGDIFLLFSFCYLYYYMKSLDFNFLFLLVPFFQNIYFSFCYFQINFLSLICFFLLIGAIGKSAQIGLHTWLPDAMEGPTPVSALIHAATMVTAGVFLIVKCSFIFEFSNNILLLITFLGGLTSIFASTIGFVQYDVKKIIAYSTCSQLGLMFFICGFSCYSLGFFHLLTHACFKALLFLVAGALIHQVQDEQDFRKFGGFLTLLPFIYSVLLIGSIALMGFPFLAGFYSKDLIIESILFFDYDFILFFQFLILLITVGTCLYSLRLLFKTFFWFPNGFFSVYQGFHKISFFIFFVLFLLTLFSIFMGYLLSEIFSISGSLFFANVIFYFSDNFYLIENEFLPFYIKIIPLILSFSMSLGYICFLELRYLLFFFYKLHYIFLKYVFPLNIKIFKNFNLNLIFLIIFDFFFFFFKKFYLFHIFCVKKWFFDSLQNKIFALVFLKQSFNFFFFIDKGFLELIGPYGLTKISVYLSSFVLKLHNFYIDSYYSFIFILFFFFL